MGFLPKSVMAGGLKQTWTGFVTLNKGLNLSASRLFIHTAGLTNNDSGR